MQALTDGASITYAVALYRAGAYAESVGFGRAVGRNIKSVRVGRDWSQTDLAKRIHALDPELAPLPGRISEWESGRYNAIELKNLMLLAIALECSMDVLLQGAHKGYDAVMGHPVAAPQPALSAEDRELLALVKNEQMRQQAVKFLKWPDPFRAAVLEIPVDSPHQEQGSHSESPPAGQAAGGETHQKRGRTRRGAGGRRR